MNDPVNEWRQQGIVHLWRYKPEKGGLNGWHFTADSAGLDSTIELIERVALAKHPGKRTVKLTTPSKKIVNGPFSPVRDRKVIAPSSLQLSVDKSDPADSWEIAEEGDRLRLQLGAKSVVELLEGFRLLKRQGYGDFLVGPTRGKPAQNIWLW
jgi:hypothetical protein